MADAPKLVGTDSLKTAYPKINQAIENSNNALNDSASATITANNAKANADHALSISESTQNQLDTIIVESGTSDAEVLQARSGYQVLNDRLNDMSVIKDDATATKYWFGVENGLLYIEEVI
jgi:hypothetical protein